MNNNLLFVKNKKRFMTNITITAFSSLSMVFTMLLTEKESLAAAFEKDKNPTVKITAVPGNFYIKASNSDNADQVINRGIEEAYEAYRAGGITGMQIAVDKCYSRVTEKSSMDEIKRCFSMDLVSLKLDQSMGSLMGFPAHEYFSGEKVINRAENAFTGSAINKNIWKNSLYNEWTPLILEQSNIVAEKMFK